jgi:hypothetical protein
MPWSVEEGKEWITDRVVKCSPRTLLDVGAGSGTYELVLRPAVPDCLFVAIEVHEPYVAQFDLARRYDEVLVGDARHLTWPEADVVVLGDVIEHMSREHAEGLWSKARATARQAVFVSLPIIELAQGPMFGNEHERHLDTWNHDEVMAMPGVVAGKAGSVVGVYEVAPS